jgi:hypothetical protein
MLQDNFKVGVEDWVYPRAHQVVDVVQVDSPDETGQIGLVVPCDWVALYQPHLAR